MIQDQYDEVFEVVYIMKGAAAIGYRLFDEIFYGQKMIMKNDFFHKNKKNNTIINDYSCLKNKCSEFLYQPINKVEALSIDKHFFSEIMEKEPMCLRIKE